MPRTVPLSVKMSELRESFGGRCRDCDAVAFLEFAHLRRTGVSGRGRGGRERYYDIRRNPSHFALLCPLHHELLDYPDRFTYCPLALEWRRRDSPCRACGPYCPAV